MNKFVSQKTTTIIVFGRKLSISKNDVTAHCVCPCCDITSGVGREISSMDADTGKILAEARFHKSAGRRIQRLARLTQDFVGTGRGFGLSYVASADAFHLQVWRVLFLLAVIARSAAGTGALRFRHPHDLFGDAVGFLFVGVAGSVYRQLGLES
jgi:hypothetical protein